MTFIRDRWNAERKLKVNPDGSINTNAVLVDEQDIKTIITYVDEDGNYTYVGEAESGTAISEASWRIRRVEEVGSLVIILWAGGTNEFNKVWDDRGTYTYM